MEMNETKAENKSNLIAEEVFNPQKRIDLILTRTEECNAECCEVGQHKKEIVLGIGIDLLANIKNVIVVM